MKRIILFFVTFLAACGSGWNLTPPLPDSPLSGNTASNISTGATQTLVFQGSQDVATGNPVYFHVPLPAPALEARIYLYGQQLSTLHYSEVPLHTHTTPNNATANTVTSHTHRLLVNTSVLYSFGLAGSSAATGTWQCGFYAGSSGVECNRSGTTSIIENTSTSHRHNLTIDDAGVAALDESGNTLPVSNGQKTYPDHLQVLLDGEEITPRFNLNPLGDGSKDHLLNTQGTMAEISDLFSEAGHHRFTFRIQNAQNLTSQGGGIQYVLWVRIAPGPWPLE